MTSVFVANGLSFGAWAGAIPRVREAGGLDEADLGVVLLFVSLGAVAAMQVAGRMAARLGLVRACWGGALLLGAVLPLPAVVTGFGPLCAAAAAMGFAMGWLDVCMNAHAAGMERRWGAAIMSSFHAGWSLGQLLGATVAGLLAWARVPLVPTLLAGGALVWAAGWPGLLLTSGGETPERVRFAWPSRAMLALCAVIGASFAIEAAVADWSAVFLRSALGASPGMATSSISVFAATMVVCRLVGDWTVRRLGPVRVVAGGGVLAAAGLVLAVLSPTVLLAACAFALVGLGLANIVPVVFSTAGRGGPASVAMVSTAGYGAMMAAPPLIGLVSHEFGLRAGLLLVAAGAAGMALLGRRFR